MQLDTRKSVMGGDLEIDYLERAGALAPTIEALAPEIERERRLPPSLLAALHEAGLFRLLLPRTVGGAEVAPDVFFQVIEEIAKADASTAWCLGQALGCSMSAAYLDPTVAWSIFGSDPRAVLAWGPGPKARAVAVPGGYRVSGTWSFASGGRHATWLGGHCPIFDGDGKPCLGTDGRVLERTMLFPAASATMADVWNVVGLKGTGSDNFTVTDLFVRHDHSVIREFEQECREPGPLYRISSTSMYAIGFAGVALGIARATLDSFVQTARDKTPRGMKNPLRDNAVVQSQAAQAEARLQSARLYLLQSVREIWQAINISGAITVDQRMTIRLASTYAIHQAREAVDFAYHAAGATAIFESNPFERRFRDIHTVSQQLQGRQAHFETVGNYLLGGDPDLLFV